MFHLFVEVIRALTSYELLVQYPLPDTACLTPELSSLGQDCPYTLHVAYLVVADADVLNALLPSQWCSRGTCMVLARYR